jgi:hypothetical protein
LPDFKSGAFNHSATHPSIPAATGYCNHSLHGTSSGPIITENNKMATTVETGFSNVDASRDAENLVEYLGLAAKHLASHRRAGYEMRRLRLGAAALEVGCGAGEACIELAGLVSPSGRVAGVVPSDAMLGAARRTVDAGGPLCEEGLISRGGGRILHSQGSAALGKTRSGGPADIC